MHIYREKERRKMLCAAFVASIILTHKVGEEGREGEGAARGGGGVVVLQHAPQHSDR